jgi:pimeloyl-ACP methyl ester carboxylesterase
MPDRLTIEGIGDIVARGLRQLLPGDAPFDLVGFSFGAPVASYVASQLGPRVRHFVVAGSRFVKDTELEYPTLVNWKAIADPAGRLAAHRRNLSIMMIANERNIDDLAVHIQSVNTPRARYFGPKLDPLGKLQEYLPRVRPSVSITGVSGAQDQFTQAFMHRQEAGLKSIHPAARFHELDGAGHWVQYEAAEAFNALLLDVLSGK